MATEAPGGGGAVLVWCEGEGGPPQVLGVGAQPVPPGCPQVQVHQATVIKCSSYICYTPI